MPTVQETAALSQTPLSDAMSFGERSISWEGTFNFVLFRRVVLPLDGFVFWVRGDILNAKTSRYNSAAYNVTANNQGAAANLANVNLTIPGSLHVTTEQRQEEGGSPAINSVILSTQNDVEQFNSIDANTMYVLEFSFQGTTIQAAFRQQFKLYTPAGEYHYRGDALYSTMASQLITNRSQLMPSRAVVSNSLPIWLSLNALVPVYPSFAVPVNAPLPYAAAHIDPGSTKALQPVPYLDLLSNHWQLAHDTVKFTTYGLRNDQALDFQDYLLAAGEPDDGPFGLMNGPIFVDEKTTQVELQILAQRKTFSMEVSYYQQRARNIAQQLIESATITIDVAEVALTD